MCSNISRLFNMKRCATTLNGHFSMQANCSAVSVLARRLRAVVKQWPDYPKPGIVFEDIAPLLADHSLRHSVLVAAERWARCCLQLDAVVGLEARGFPFGVLLASVLKVPFIMVRKPGKLPGPVDMEASTKEYGQDVLVVQLGAIKPGWRVLIADDLLATGGSVLAAARLVERQGATVAAFAWLVALMNLPLACDDTGTGSAQTLGAPGLASVRKLYPAAHTFWALPVNVQPDDVESNVCYSYCLAVDIGSGTTKATLARLDWAVAGCTSTVQQLWAEQQDVLLGLNCAANGNCLSDTVLDTMTAALAEYRRRADEACAAPSSNLFVSAVATAVFRYATNGQSALAAAERALGARITCINQAEEAQLGFRTGLNFAEGLQTVAVWDLGGGSSQLTWLMETQDTGMLCMPLGTSQAVNACRQEPTRPPCDVVADLVSQAIGGTSDDGGMACWRKARSHINEFIGIGGPTSAFQATLDVCRLMPSTVDTQALREGDNAFTAQQAKCAAAWAHSSLDALSAMPQVDMVPAKVALVARLMQELDIPSLKMHAVNGSTTALLEWGDHWHRVNTV